MVIFAAILVFSINDQTIAATLNCLHYKELAVKKAREVRRTKGKLAVFVSKVEQIATQYRCP